METKRIGIIDISNFDKLNDYSQQFCIQKILLSNELKQHQVDTIIIVDCDESRDRAIEALQEDVSLIHIPATDFTEVVKFIDAVLESNSYVISRLNEMSYNTKEEKPKSYSQPWSRNYKHLFKLK